MQAYALEFAKRGAAVVVNDLGGGMKGEGESSISSVTVHAAPDAVASAHLL
jgi:hypothetical protein